MWDKHTQRCLELEHIKQIRILDYLAGEGYFPVKITKKTRKGFIAWFFSPLRSEENPSFAVYIDRNDFYDYGAGIGGSIIDLAMHLKKMRYPEAVRHLRELRYSPC